MLRSDVLIYFFFGLGDLFFMIVVVEVVDVLIIGRNLVLGLFVLLFFIVIVMRLVVCCGEDDGNIFFFEKLKCICFGFVVFLMEFEFWCSVFFCILDLLFEDLIDDVDWLVSCLIGFGLFLIGVLGFLIFFIFLMLLIDRGVNDCNCCWGGCCGGGCCCCCLFVVLLKDLLVVESVVFLYCFIFMLVLFRDVIFF